MAPGTISPFRLDYVNAAGDISTYNPDFFVKFSDKRVFLVETKGQVDVDVSPKLERLRQWCDDINRVQSAVKYASHAEHTYWTTDARPFPALDPRPSPRRIYDSTRDPEPDTPK